MNSNSEFGPVNSLANLPEGNFDPEFYNRCVDIGILAYSMRPSREGPVIHIEQVLEFLSAYRFDVACKSITPIDSYGNQERGWKWFRVEFPSEYEAESCVAACNFPGRPLRFEYYRERFPVIVTMTSFCRNENAHDGKHDVVQFETMDLYPHDVIVVDTQEGLVCFSTADIYRTKGADDYMFAKKESGKIIRRLVCKHFDPVSGTLCKFGIMCSFVHVKKGKINRLLKVTSPYQELRPPKFEDDIQLSTWEFDRRHDTLVLRNLSKSLNGDDIKYMFSECEGYTGSFIRKEGNRVTAVILFNSTEAATSALLQTRDTGLNISFYGVMEDLRTLILQESRSKKEITRPLGRLAPDGSQIRNTCETNGDCNNDRVTKRDRSEPEEYSELPQSEASAVTEETEMKPSLEQPQNVFEMKDAAPINDKHEVSDCDHATSNCGT